MSSLFLFRDDPRGLLGFGESRFRRPFDLATSVVMSRAGEITA